MLAATIVFAALATPLAAAAAETWTVKSAPARAQITGGPWVLTQGTAAFPTANPGTANFAPYYQSLSTGDATHLVGYFDYRPKSTVESIVSAKSDDGGANWTFLSEVLRLDTSSGASDAGEGHPFVMTVGGTTYLYTLDRGTGVDSEGLFVRPLSPTAANPLAGAPATATPSSTTTQRTVGLTNPDGILAVVPGTTGSAVQVLYVQKNVSVSPNVTTVSLASTTDGVNFTPIADATGLQGTDIEWIGPRGSLTKYADGTYGLFFSGGISADGDADAFHFVGYAESADLKSWTVVNGLNNPLVSIDFAKDPTGGQPWYAGRVYAPSVTFAADGCTAAMTISGYATKKITTSSPDYRQIGYLTLERAGCGVTGGDGGGAPDAGSATDASTTSDASSATDASTANDASSATDASTTSDAGASTTSDAGASTTSDAGVSGGDDASGVTDAGASGGTDGGTARGGTASSNGCSCTVPGASTQSDLDRAALAALGLAAIFGARRRRRHAA
jgi:MYXO-CTERM domain-containing protein